MSLVYDPYGSMNYQGSQMYAADPGFVPGMVPVPDAGQDTAAAEGLIAQLDEMNGAVDDPNFDPLGWRNFYPLDDQFFNFDYGETYPDQVQIINNGNLEGAQVYIGEMNAQGERHGFGVLHTSDCIRRGAFRNGQFCGWGREARSEGDVITGRFVDGYLTGKGTYRNYKGNLYTGDFVDSVRTGLGDLTTNKFHYIGGFRDNRMEGKGRIEFLREGHSYEGDFHDGEINGYGAFRWKNGDLYEGTLVNGRMDGRGRYIHSNGEIYEGDYVNGQKQGYGRLTYTNGSIYEGQFTEGVPNGRGKLIENGAEREVTFNYGKLIGRC